MDSQCEIGKTAAEQNGLSSSRPLQGVNGSAPGMFQRNLYLFIQRDAPAFQSRLDMRTYLPNSPLDAGTSAPPALTLSGHKAITVSTGTRKQHTEGFMRCSSPLPRHMQTTKTRMGTNSFKIRGKNPKIIKFSPLEKADYEAAFPKQSLRETASLLSLFSPFLQLGLQAALPRGV